MTATSFRLPGIQLVSILNTGSILRVHELVLQHKADIYVQNVNVLKRIGYLWKPATDQNETDCPPNLLTQCCPTLYRTAIAIMLELRQF